MSASFICGDHGALVAYLYDECEAEERRAIGTHVALCGGCAEELASLGATREQLAAWRPPDAQLGFRVISDPHESVAPVAAVPKDAAPGDNVLRPSRWWRQPLPAWAQAAAAALIFTTGVTLGALRGSTSSRPPVESRAGNVTPVTARTADVSQSDLSALEQRLRAEMLQMRGAAAPATAGGSDAQLLERVRAMIQESEQRQQRDLALRTAEVVRDFDAQRVGDLARIERTIGQMDGTTGVEVEQQRQMLNYLIRVSQRPQ